MDTIRCPSCDRDVPEEELFCPHCEEPLGLTLFDGEPAMRGGRPPAPGPESLPDRARPGPERAPARPSGPAARISATAAPGSPSPGALAPGDRPPGAPSSGAPSAGAPSAGAPPGGAPPGVPSGVPAVPPRGHPVYARFLMSSALSEPIELEEGHVIRIGRGKQNEVCFPSHHVSRLHAEVVFEGGGWAVGDLESRNGIFVNGERVLRRGLRHGDRIQIGHFDLCYLELSKEQTFELLRRERDVSGEDTAPLRSIVEGLFGDLAKLAITEVVQLLNQHRKTGYLKIEGYRPGAPTMKLSFAEGEIEHATAGDLEGEPVVMKALGLKAGQFQFVRSGPPARRTVEARTASLLLRAAAG